MMVLNVSTRCSVVEMVVLSAPLTSYQYLILSCLVLSCVVLSCTVSGTRECAVEDVPKMHVENHLLIL